MISFHFSRIYIIYLLIIKRSTQIYLNILYVYTKEFVCWKSYVVDIGVCKVLFTYLVSTVNIHQMVYLKSHAATSPKQISEVPIKLKSHSL